MTKVSKAVVLCAGEGTRLRPLTFSKPKHLLPVAGQPLLGHVLCALSQAGLCEVGLVVGHRPEAVQQYVGDGEQWGMTATYIVQEQPLGLAHAIKQAKDFVAGEPFTVYLGDNLLENGICGFVDEFRGNGADAAIMLKAVDDPRRYGVAVLDEQQRVVRLLEKPQDPPTNLAIVGVYAFQPGIFDIIEQIKPSARGELEITDALQLMVDQGRMVKARVIDGFWEDAGEPKSLLVANRRYLDMLTSSIQCSLGDNCHIEGNVVIGKGTRVDDSTIQGPCLIGRNCVIERARIGPYVAIGDGCVISDSQIEDSVIQDHCQISQLPAGLKGSVLGEKVQVVGGAPMAAPLTMILGDMAQIRML